MENSEKTGPRYNEYRSQQGKYERGSHQRKIEGNKYRFEWRSEKRNGLLGTRVKVFCPQNQSSFIACHDIWFPRKWNRKAAGW